jgi:integrase-like protein
MGNSHALPLPFSPQRGVRTVSRLSAQKPKLLDQVWAAIRLRHYSLRTEEAYVHWIRRFIFFHNTRHPLEMGEQEITHFLSALATEGHVSASTQNQALCALLFLYRQVFDRQVGWFEEVVRARPTATAARRVEPARSESTLGSSRWDSLAHGESLVWCWLALAGVFAPPRDGPRLCQTPTRGSCRERRLRSDNGFTDCDSRTAGGTLGKGTDSAPTGPSPRVWLGVLAGGSGP